MTYNLSFRLVRPIKSYSFIVYSLSVVFQWSKKYVAEGGNVGLFRGSCIVDHKIRILSVWRKIRLEYTNGGSLTEYLEGRGLSPLLKPSKSEFLRSKLW